MEPDMMLLQTLCAITVLFSLQSSGSIQWPAGTYGIPKPIAGCPQADGFRWHTGWMLQRDDYHYQNNGSESNNSRSLEFHIDGKVDTFRVNRSFCMKEDTTKDFKYKRPTWPRGKYCIYKESDRCPKGLILGWVFWADSYSNDEKDGFFPDGRYSQYTEINFCCRTDGDKDEPILLPSKSPFFLLAYESAKCQMVKWAVTSLEWIYYFTHNKENDKRNGSYPYNAGKMHPTIYYCYYQVPRVTPTKVPTSAARITSPHILTSKISIASKLTSSSTAFATSTTQTLKVKSSPVVPTTTAKTSKLTSSSPTQAWEMASWSYVISMTLRTTEITHLSPITPTAQTLKVTSSPIVSTTTAKTSTSSSSTQASEMASSSYVISMTPEVTYLSPITPTTDTLIKTTPRGKPWTSTTKVPPKIGYNETLTAVNGTFQSTNCPRNYSDGQYCFWRIALTTAQQIYLIFSSFSLQNENNRDAFYMYDGQNATGEALEEFNGGHPPPKEGICISSNRVFVVFKSDKAGSFHGFSVSYYGVSNSEPCAIAASQASKESGKKDEKKQPQRKGLNGVVVVVPVVSAILIAALLVAGICYMRKRRKRVEGTDDEIYLRLTSEPAGSVENTDL